MTLRFVHTFSGIKNEIDIDNNLHPFISFGWAKKERRKQTRNFVGKAIARKLLESSKLSKRGEFSQLFRAQTAKPLPMSIFTPHFDFPVSSFPLMASSRKLVNVETDLLLEEEGAEAEHT